MPLVIILAALCGGLPVLVFGWQTFGLYTPLLAAALASTVGLLAGIALAVLRVGRFRAPSDPTRIFDVVGLTAPRDRDLRLVPMRLYFDIERGPEIIKDEIGIEAHSLDEALDDARSVIREMVVDLIDDGYDGDWVLVVRDAQGASVARLPIERTPPQIHSDRRSA
ncbi:DUF6894 family protein [Methylobacterium sp. P5_C11]